MIIYFIPKNTHNIIICDRCRREIKNKIYYFIKYEYLELNENICSSCKWFK